MNEGFQNTKVSVCEFNADSRHGQWYIQSLFQSDCSNIYHVACSRACVFSTTENARALTELLEKFLIHKVRPLKIDVSFRRQTKIKKKGGAGKVESWELRGSVERFCLEVVYSEGKKNGLFWSALISWVLELWTSYL